MVSLDSIAATITADPMAEYCCDRNLNLYKMPAGKGLVTQVAAGRQLRIFEIAQAGQALRVCLCEDDYPGWLLGTDITNLSPATTAYQAPTLSPEAIQARIPKIIDFTKAAMAHPNEYLWGGTVAPHYDCSGLVQAAFAAAGIRLPRDSYQQETFVEPIEPKDLKPGDLIFFGTPDRTTHVALHLENGRYIHSSGKDQGRNGIGIDSLKDLSNPISQRYYQQLRCCGRVTRSYCAQGKPVWTQ